jgi:predicted dehydrogenase
MMDFGTYAVDSLRQVLRAEPVAVASAEPRIALEDENVDAAMRATYDFPGGVEASIYVDLQAKGGYPLPWLTGNWPTYNKLPKLTVRLKEEEVSGAEVGEGQKHVLTKTFVLFNLLGPHIWHRIDIIEGHTVSDVACGKVVKTWTETKNMKVYEWQEKGDGKVGEVWWTSYRHQLEEFVHRVMKREGSGVWVDLEDSIRQMEVIDATYVKAGLPVRPTSALLET